MNKILTQLKRSQPVKEEGMTVVEVMVASIIIAIIFIFTATGLTASFKTSAYVENRTKAANYADNALAIAKQAPFRQLWVTIPPINSSNSSDYGAGKCNSTFQTIASPTGTALPAVVSGEGSTPFPGIIYCNPRQATNESNAVGATFYVQTDVRAAPVSGQTWQKHVVITVRWQDVYSGENKWNTYQTSFTRTPTVGECIPPSITSSNTTPGCVSP